MSDTDVFIPDATACTPPPCWHVMHVAMSCTTSDVDIHVTSATVAACGTTVSLRENMKRWAVSNNVPHIIIVTSIHLVKSSIFSVLLKSQSVCNVAPSSARQQYIYTAPKKWLSVTTTVVWIHMNNTDEFLSAFGVSGRLERVNEIYPWLLVLEVLCQGFDICWDMKRSRMTKLHRTSPEHWIYRWSTLTTQKYSSSLWSFCLNSVSTEITSTCSIINFSEVNKLDEVTPVYKVEYGRQCPFECMWQTHRVFFL